MSNQRMAVTAYAGILTSVLAAALVLTDPTPWIALAGALILACVPAGAAIMSWVDSGEAMAQAGLTLVLSLSIFALASSIMIWLSSWQPRALLALAGISLCSCGARIGGTGKLSRS